MEVRTDTMAVFIPDFERVDEILPILMGIFLCGFIFLTIMAFQDKGS